MKPILLILSLSALAIIASAHDCAMGQYRDPGMPCRNCPSGNQPMHYLKAFAREHPECPAATSTSIIRGGRESTSTSTKSSRTADPKTLVTSTWTAVVKVTPSKVATTSATLTVDPELQPALSNATSGTKQSGSSSHPWLIPVLICAGVLLVLVVGATAVVYFRASKLLASQMKSLCPRRGELNHQNRDAAAQLLPPTSSTSSCNPADHTSIDDQALVQISTAGHSQSHSHAQSGITIANKPESLNRSDEV